LNYKVKLRRPNIVAIFLWITGIMLMAMTFIMLVTWEEPATIKDARASGLRRRRSSIPTFHTTQPIQSLSVLEDPSNPESPIIYYSLELFFCISQHIPTYAPLRVS
jgi:hypothetical protein